MVNLVPIYNIKGRNMIKPDKNENYFQILNHFSNAGSIQSTILQALNSFKSFLDILDTDCEAIEDLFSITHLIISLCTSHETKIFYFWEPQFLKKEIFCKICICSINLLVKYANNFFKNES